MNKNNEQKYIALKLEGCVDDKQKLGEKYGIDKGSIVTIAATIQEYEKIKPEDYAKLQDKHNAKIQSIKNVCTLEREDGFGGIRKFYDWYMKYDDIGTCCYCGVDKNDANGHEIFNNSKRGRGKTLEVERVVTFPENVYSPANCRLACHICNNAKSDFLSAQDFEPIAKGINEFWKKKLENDDIDFPEEIYKQF